MPELGLSEDVFAEGATTPEVETTDEGPAATEEAAADAVVEVPEGVDDQVQREAEASEGEGDTPGSTVDQPNG